MFKLTSSHPFDRIGKDPVWPYDQFTMSSSVENYQTEHVVFEVVDIDHPLNAIIGRPSLYWFMTVTHYDYPMMKISTSTRSALTALL
jgi:hypothetical protein